MKSISKRIRSAAGKVRRGLRLISSKEIKTEIVDRSQSSSTEEKRKR